ncbi:hypothetical protein D9M72_650040 [compost metagenome]
MIDGPSSRKVRTTPSRQAVSAHSWIARMAILTCPDMCKVLAKRIFSFKTRRLRELFCAERISAFSESITASPP